MEMVGVEPTLPRCKRGALPPELHPRCGRVDSNHHSARHHIYSAKSSPMLSVRKKKGRSAGFEPEPRGSRPRMLPLHHDHHGADAGREAAGFSATTGTTGLEPAVSRLTSDCSCH
jgi:hypothetical protein